MGKDASARIILFVLICFFALIPAAPANGATFSPGDVFVSLDTGQVQWRRADGTLVAVLNGTNDGHAEGMGFDAAGNLYVTHWFGTNFSGNTVDEFDTTGTLKGTFGSGYNCNPMSIVFDATGRAFVGQADCDADILQFSATGVLQSSFDAATETRGTVWVDIGSDLCTIFYTSQGTNVKRFDVCGNSQLPDFNAAPLPEPSNGAHALKLLPDGGVLVADFSSIVRLDASGHIVQTYSADSESPQCWLGVALTADGASFWASNWCTSNVHRFDLSSGLSLQSFHTGTEPFSVKGVAVVRGEVAGPGPTPPEQAAGRMTGGGSVFTSDGRRVTHGFELHCDPAVHPNNLQINWGGGNKFHLEQLTSATCTDDPAINARPPNAPFDTYNGTGEGRYNGESGATAEWTFTDAGEPGANDRATITIRDAAGNTVLVVSGNLHFGNHQAHQSKK